jgi:hypothetical protein
MAANLCGVPGAVNNRSPGGDRAARRNLRAARCVPYA